MATELADGVWRIGCSGVNAYLLDREELVLVDAGTPLDAGRIRRGVAEAGHGLADVDRVLVTHFDVDHVGSLWRLDDALDAPLYMPEPDASFLARTTNPDWSRKGVLQRALRPLARPPDLELYPVSDGDHLGDLTAYRTPGHTPGHTVYADEDVALLGDLVFGNEGTYATPPWFVNYDSARVEASILDLAERGPDFDAGCQGHGAPLPTSAATALSALADRL